MMESLLASFDSVSSSTDRRFVRKPCRLDMLPIDVQQRVAEGLGTSLAAAASASAAWAALIDANSASCFRPLSYVHASPATGIPFASIERQASIARVRRAGAGLDGWRNLANAAVNPADAVALWHTPSIGGSKVSHRHSVAICGAPYSDAEVALLFGGNVSRSVAGRWETDDELLLVRLPRSIVHPAEECLVTPVTRAAGAVWPVGRWGASLTLIREASYLLGGWSSNGDTQTVWELRLREACAEWNTVGSQGRNRPRLTAFHTATPLEDGKRLAFIGGLSDRGSAQGVWIFDSSSGRWSLASDVGPSCAGHAAGCVGNQVVVFGGVERSPEIRLLPSDVFSATTALFDVRRNQWNTDYRTHGGPSARRNPVYATLGKHLIISSGWHDRQCTCLADTWVLDVERGIWKEVVCKDTPKLEGHKAVMSGFDMFTFGGHDAPGKYPSLTISIHALSIAWESKRKTSTAMHGMKRGQRNVAVSRPFREHVHAIFRYAMSFVRSPVLCCRRAATAGARTSSA